MDGNRRGFGVRRNADHARSGVARDHSVRVVMRDFRAGDKQKQRDTTQRYDADR
jgi:hypothetical protein